LKEFWKLVKIWWSNWCLCVYNQGGRNHNRRDL